jgi:hypothetical protein
LAGSASSTWESTYDDYVVFSYDGNASVSYEYDYTPAAVVPEPTTIIVWSLLGGLAIAFGRWRKRKAV